MKNRKGFPGVVALGMVVLLVALSPVLATESESTRNPDGFQAMKKAANNSGLASLAETEGGAATKGRITNMFLVDGANGGTIYEYNYEMRQIIRTCPTPVPANGVDADGLAYAGPRSGSPARAGPFPPRTGCSPRSWVSSVGTPTWSASGTSAPTTR